MAIPWLFLGGGAKLRNRLCLLKSGAQRFKKTDAAESHIGPGTYSVEADTITAKASADVGKVSSAFASTTLRDGFLGV